MAGILCPALARHGSAGYLTSGNYSKVRDMSDDDPVARDPSTPATEEAFRDRLRAIAARLREAAEDLGGEVMVELPSRLGDHEGLLIALANELEQLVK